MAQTESTSSGNQQYEEIEVVRDPDGVIAVITERKENGAISFGIYREFERAGVPTRGSFLARRHVQAARRLLDDLEERLEAAEDRSRAKRRERE